MAQKHILVICATGVATSTVVVQKIKDFTKSRGLEVTISQGKVADILRGQAKADFIVATTEVPSSITIPVVPGLPFLTGVGLDDTYAEIAGLIESD